jgi:hypothetical protein
LPREETTPPVMKMNRVMDLQCKEAGGESTGKRTERPTGTIG